MHIKRKDDVPAYASPHGEVVHELIGHTGGGSERHSVAQITLHSGKASRKHYHPEAEESYYILAGQGRVVMDDETRDLKAGDALLIPPNVVHQIFNDSTNELLIFLAFCIPAWKAQDSIFLD